MSRQITIAMLRAQIRAKGGQILTRGAAVRATDKVKCRCANKHEFLIRVSNLRLGKWCFTCGRGAPLTLEEVHSYAKSRSGTCLTASIVNSASRVTYRCSEGHEWNTSASSARAGTWCPTCYATGLPTLATLHALARAKNGGCLSPVFITMKEKYRWRCAKHHEWEARADAVKKGEWCPTCNLPERITIERLQSVAVERGGRCLSTEYLGTEEKLRWQCALGHEWSATYRSVFKGGWCPTCAGNVPHTLEEFQRIAVAHGGRCLSLVYRSVHLGLFFECAASHRWRTQARLVLRGTWCPKCAAGKAPPLEELRAIARKHRGALISMSCSSATEKLLWRCSAGHDLQISATQVKKGTWCRTCKRKKRATYEQARRLALSNRGTFIGPPVLTVSTSCQWRCRNGHEWSMKYRMVKEGRWCPTCKRDEEAKERAQKLREMQTIAVSRGGRCRSALYLSCGRALEWECAKAHVWMATPANIKRGTWCPTCNSRPKGTLIEMNEIARRRGGNCVSDEYFDRKYPLRWRCREGHEWEASPDSVKNGTWCPVCIGRKPRVRYAEAS